jgi:hypothetical protein
MMTYNQALSVAKKYLANSTIPEAQEALTVLEMQRTQIRDLTEILKALGAAGIDLAFITKAAQNMTHTNDAELRKQGHADLLRAKDIMEGSI